MMQLSIVVPTLNEAGALPACLASLQPFRERLELVLVDGGSSDDTVSLGRPLVDRVIASAAGRARQMNVGWRAARGQWVLFLHADTRLGSEHLAALNEAFDGPCWGRFDLRLDHQARIYRVIETMINLRSRISGIATGDQAMFVSRQLLEQVDGFPEIELMEDIALSRSLKRFGRPRCLRPPVASSARRWEANGVWRTIVLMWLLRLGFYLGARPAWLARFYRRAR